MCRKCLIMEIKDKYAIAMDETGDIIRIKIKKEMHTGDEIYVLTEDLYNEKTIETVPLFTKYKGTMKSFALMAATIIICFIVAVSTSDMGDAYAKVMLDGNRSIEFIVDDDYRIIEAVSKDGSFTDEELRSYKGKNLSDIKENLEKTLRKNNNTITTGYEIIGEEKENSTKEDLEKFLNGMFGKDAVDVDEIYDDIIDEVEDKSENDDDYDRDDDKEESEDIKDDYDSDNEEDEDDDYDDYDNDDEDDENDD